MSSEEFEKLHEIYNSLYEELKLMPQRALSRHGEERKRLQRTFDERHGEAEEVLQGMDAELRTAPAAYRNAMSTKLRLHRRDLGKLQREMASSDLGLGPSARPTDGGHQGIYGSQNQQSVSRHFKPVGDWPTGVQPHPAPESNESDSGQTYLQSQRSLLLQGHESLTSASQSIERSQRIATETDQIGSDIIEELGGQREQLDRARNRLVNTGEHLSRSRKLLRAMSRRLMTNKLLLAVIILMELAILGAVVYLKFFR